MSASALLYSLNTWLPELMRRNGFGQTASLAFLMFGNGGGFLERSSVLTRSIGPKPAVATCFLTGAVAWPASEDGSFVAVGIA